WRIILKLYSRAARRRKGRVRSPNDGVFYGIFLRPNPICNCLAFAERYGVPTTLSPGLRITSNQDTKSNQSSVWSGRGSAAELRSNCGHWKRQRNWRDNGIERL